MAEDTEFSDILRDGTLFLGAEPRTPEEWDVLFDERNVKHVVRCVATDPEEDARLNLETRGTGFLHLKLDDMVGCDIAQYFESSAKFIHEGIQATSAGEDGAAGVAKGSVFIHCQAGVSRSATILLSYLVQYRQMEVKHALEQVVRPVRPCVQPNVHFAQQLGEMEVRVLKGGQGVPSLGAEYFIDAAQVTWGSFCPRSVIEEIYYSEACGQNAQKHNGLIQSWDADTETCRDIMTEVMEEVSGEKPSQRMYVYDGEPAHGLDPEVEKVRSLLKQNKEDYDATKAEYLAVVEAKNVTNDVEKEEKESANPRK